MTDYVADCGYVTAYPIRPGYASTIQKLQGSELEHVTIWLDVKKAKRGHQPGAARWRLAWWPCYAQAYSTGHAASAWQCVRSQALGGMFFRNCRAAFVQGAERES